MKGWDIQWRLVKNPAAAEDLKRLSILKQCLQLVLQTRKTRSSTWLIITLYNRSIDVRVSTATLARALILNNTFKYLHLTSMSIRRPRQTSF